MPPQSGARHRSTAAAIAGFACAALAAFAPLAAQTVTVTGPAGAPITDGTPRFSISTSGFTAAQLPLQLRLQVSLTADFSAGFFADTTVAGTSAQVTVPHLLPPQVNIWWRAVARTAQGTLIASNADGPHRTSAWLSLITPNLPTGTTVTTARPTFLWSAVGIYPPVRPWEYHFAVVRYDGFPAFTSTQPDTTYTPPADLESNTPYRWSVTAISGTGDSITVRSDATFVILSPSAPIATVLYQSFPTPFPSGTVNYTCIWFDLKRQSDVSLEILDLRMNHVARLLPAGKAVGVAVGSTLPPGRYGRQAAVGGIAAQCDQRLSWDGTDDAGRVVRPGVYLIKFVGDGVTTVKKVLFRGR